MSGASIAIYAVALLRASDVYHAIILVRDTPDRMLTWHSKLWDFGAALMVAFLVLHIGHARGLVSRTSQRLSGYVAKSGLSLASCRLAHLSSILDFLHPHKLVLEAAQGFPLLMSIPRQPLAVDMLADVHLLEFRSQDFSNDFHAESTQRPGTYSSAAEEQPVDWMEAKLLHRLPDPEPRSTSRSTPQASLVFLVTSSELRQGRSIAGLEIVSGASSPRSAVAKSCSNRSMSIHV